MLVKLEWLGYRMAVSLMKNLWRYVKPFSYNTSVLRTDGRTDGQTDGQTDRIAISISRVSLLTSDKNHICECWKSGKMGPGSRSGFGSVPKCNECSLYRVLPSYKFHENQSTSFWVILLTGRPTDRHTNRQTDQQKWKHTSFFGKFGGGNELQYLVKL